jgi:membrane-associated phospholipid phosphatase
MTMTRRVRVSERNPLVARPELVAPRVLGAVAVLAVVGTAATYAAGVRTAAGQRLDANLLTQLEKLPFRDAAGTIRTSVVVLAAAVAVGVALTSLWTRRWRAVGAAAISVALSLWLAELLKASLQRPDPGHVADSSNTFPSAHMATTTALCVAVVVLWPRAEDRVVVGVLVVFALGFEAAYNVAGHAHRPSDVVGGFLLAVAVSAVALVACGVPADTQWRHDARLS